MSWLTTGPARRASLWRPGSGRWHELLKWLTSMLEDIDDPEIIQPVESFASWRHLRRVRSLSDEKPTRDPVHSGKHAISKTNQIPDVG